MIIFVKKNMSIHYINIANAYTENVKRSHKQMQINYFKEMIAKHRETRDFSTFEILKGGKHVKFYFDIEKIPEDQPDLIHKIRNDLITFISETSGTNITRSAITFNKSSCTHAGLSYHLYFPEYKTGQNNIRNLLLTFLDTPKGSGYRGYIDCSVYNNGRLFRCPGQKGIAKGDEIVSEDNFHEIIEGEISDCIIQYVWECQTFDHVYEYKRGKDSDDISAGDQRRIIRRDKDSEKIDKKIDGILNILGSKLPTENELSKEARELLKNKDEFPKNIVGFLENVESGKINFEKHGHASIRNILQSIRGKITK